MRQIANIVCLINEVCIKLVQNYLPSNELENYFSLNNLKKVKNNIVCLNNSIYTRFHVKENEKK